MGRTEVTQAQWQAVMGNNPSYFKNCPQCPVETVSWEDAQRFVDKLNAQNDGFKYRLPTEAEWEYAARSGTTGDYAGNLDSMAWYSGNSGNKTHEVATKQPNAWGLYDMHGNVWEWCEDWYGDYPSGAVTNPTGAASGSYRVFRGGSWYFDAVNLRSAYRNRNSPSLRLSRLGFRVVRY
jgi:formylglycine-generating enzyme required for sulfatase activity